MNTLNNALPSQDSAVGRALKTVLQTVIGFIVGLFVVVWAVPGVPHAVLTYTYSHLFEILLMVGVPSGLTSLIWNLFRKNIPNY